MTVMVATPLEALGLEQCVDEVNHQTRGHEAGERIVEDHGSLLETIAGDGVADREREERKPDGQHDDVQHCGCSEQTRVRARHEFLPSNADKIEEPVLLSGPKTCHRSHRNSRGWPRQSYRNFIKTTEPRLELVFIVAPTIL